MDTWRCVICGTPVCDHVPFRYWWPAWWRHKLLRAVSVVLGRLKDTTP